MRYCRVSRRFVVSGILAGLSGVIAPWTLTNAARSVRADSLFPAAEISWHLDGYPEIDAMAPLIRRVMSAVATSFAGRIGQVYGFNAGALYPAIFARDFATVAEFAAFLFGSQFLRTPVEEFLFTQESLASIPSYRGAIAATISPSGEVDKATVVSDEETSLIHAAFVNYQSGAGDDWLLSLIGNKSVLARLNETMDYLKRERRDSATGLIWRAHTTDWGDVKLEGGPVPTDFILGDAVIATIFDQAFTYRAFLELQQMNAAVGADDIAARYSDDARILRDTVNLYLWDAVRGYYRIHKNLTPISIPVDTDRIFALGNHIAVETGLANSEQVDQIFANTLDVEYQSGVSRPGLTLWPPYPSGVFKHPNMQWGAYQNGGIWDWWAGQQVLGEFQRGGSEIAIEHLLATARHWQRTGQISEWFHNPSGSDQGSLDFGGAAASMGLAVTRGLFGIEISPHSFTINSRLHPRSGDIQLTHQPTGIRLDFSQTQGPDWIAATINSNAADGGTFRCTVPSDWENALILVDDAPVGQHIDRRLNDSYTEAVTLPSGGHVVAALRATRDDLSSAWNNGYARFNNISAGRGFWISNSSGIGMLDAYKDLGDVGRFGVVVSGRFILEGHVAQASQKYVLQWDPGQNRATIAPIFNIFSAAGLDDWLEAYHGIPRPDSDGPRIQLVDRDPGIREVFFGEPDWGGYFGLPTAWFENDVVSVLRTERAALQRWKVDVPWAQVGMVTIVNGGSIAVASGLVPYAASQTVSGFPDSP